MFDIETEVLLDGTHLGRGSVVQGFSISFVTAPGVHELSLRTSARGAKKYTLDLRQGANYIVQVEYSRTWGNWNKQCRVQRTG